MPNKHFFATNNDLLTLFSKVEPDCPLEFIAMDDLGFKSVFNSSVEAFSCLGPGAPDSARAPRYLVCRRSDSPSFVNSFVHRLLASGKRDQLSHPHSVVLAVGGQYSDTVMITSSWGTASIDPRSLALYNIVIKFVKKWRRVGQCYLSPQADVVFKSGGRLTSNIAADSSFDLVEE